MRHKPFLKIISSILVLTFSWSNLLFAADPRQMLLDAKAGFELEDQRRMGGGETGSANEEASQAAVEQQNVLSDLQKLNLSLTTENGDILRYVGDKLETVQRPDGTMLRNITLAGDGSIQSADLRLSDGSVQVFQNGQVLGYLTPDGTNVFYENGRVQKTVSKEGVETLYSYIEDEQGAVLSTVLENSASKTTYDALGKLKEVLDKVTGRRTAYDGGILQSITDSLGTQLSFSAEEIEGRIRVVLDSLSGPAFNADTWNLPDGSILRNIVWDAEGAAQDADLHDVDGNVYRFSARVLDSIQIPGGVLTGMTWNANALDAALLTDASGNRWEYAGGQIARVTQPDGSVLEDLVFDAQNNPTDGILTDEQGNVWTFEGGALNKIVLVGGALLENIVWSGSDIQDCTWTEAGRRFMIAGGVVTQVFLADGSVLTDIVWDAQGSVKDALMTDADGCEWTWANGGVVSVELTDGSLLTGLTWDAEGNMQNALLTDPLQNRYIYSAGELTTITAADGSVLSNIVWAADGKIKSGDLRDLQNNVYTYIDGYPSKMKLADNTLLENAVWDAQGNLKDGYYTDLSGNRWTYAAGQPTAVRYPDGSVMSNIFWSGNKVFGGTLTADGAVYTYPSNGSSLPTQIRIADGTVLRNISWTQTNTVLSANITLSTGEVISFSNGAVVQATLPGGSVVSNIIFDVNGNLTNALVTHQNNQYTITNGQLTQIKLAAGPILTNLTWNGNSLAGATSTDAQGRRFNYASGTLSSIVLTDGSVLTGPFIASNNLLTTAKLTDPEGNQWTYSSGAVTRIVLADGSVSTNAIFSSNGAFNYAMFTDTVGTRYYYNNGVVNSILMADNSSLSNVVWDSAGKLQSGLYNDKYGIQHTFANGSVSRIRLNDGSILTSLVWDASGKLDGAILTDTTGTKYYYTAKKLTQVTTSANVTTSVAYTATTVTLTTPGVGVYEYRLSDKALSKWTRPDGSYTLYGLFWGSDSYRIQDVSASGLVSVYEYSGTSAERRDILTGAQASSFTSGAIEIVYPTAVNNTTTTMSLTATQTKTGNITRTLTYSYVNGIWTAKRSDLDSSTSQTTTATVTANGRVYGGYLCELRMEGAKANLYVYNNGAPRPATPTISLDAFSGAATMITATAANATYTTKNLGNVASFTKASLASPLLTQNFNKLQGTTTLAKPVITAKRLNVTSLTLRAINFTAVVTPSVSYKNVSNIKKPALTVTRKFYAQLTKPALSVTLKTTTATAKNTGFTKPVLDFVRPVPTVVKRDLTLDRPAFSASPRTLDLNRRESPAWISFDALYYGTDGSLLEIVQKDGSTLEFENGALKSARDASGALTNFNFSESGLGNLLGTSLVQGGVTTKYDAQGSIASVKLADTTIFYKPDGGIDFILKDDGTEVHDLVFGDDGAVKNSTFVTAGGDKRYYEDGHLKRVIRGDESILDFDYDLEKLRSILATLTTPEDIIYHFDYEADIIRAVLDESIVPAADAVTGMEYDLDFNLKKAVRQNQQIIEYAQDQKVSRVIDSGSAPKVFGYAADGSYTVTQGSAQSFYDANDVLLKTILYPDSQNPHKLEVLYQYGKIRQIKKNDALTFLYSYTFDVQGAESTEIQDLEEKNRKMYRGGLLRESLDEDTSVLSSYAYDVQSKISGVTVTRLGRPLHAYQYAYSGALTIVTDEEGAVRTYGENQKLLFLQKGGEKYAYTYAAGADGEEIAQESLAEKMLPDGSTAFYDTDKPSNIARILLADGTLITDIALNADNTFQRAAVTFSSGLKQVFGDGSVLEEIYPDGMHYFYQSGRLSKVIDAQGRSFEYAYDLNSSGVVTKTWVRTGDALLKYDAQGALLGLEIDGALTLEEVHAQTQHTYLGGTPGLSFDGDFSTWQYDSSRHYSGGIGNVESTHTFSRSQILQSVTFSMFAYGAANGEYTQDYEANYDVKVLRNGQWELVPGSFGGTNKIHGGGSYYATSGVVTLNNLNLSGVTAVKASAHGFSNSSGNSGNSSAGAGIYEIQYLLADQANLFFTTQKNASNQITGYTLAGYPGTLSFDAQGGLLAGTPSNLSAQASSLDGVMAVLADKPYFQKMTPPAAQASCVLIAKSAIIESSAVMTQEYTSSTGTLQTQTKADHTITLFENNKPSKVTSQGGEILIEYFYDAAGNIERVNLKNARAALPSEVLKAKQSVEDERLAALRALALQKNLTTQSIDSQVDPQRQTLQGQLDSLQNQFNDISGTKASGKKAKNQKGDALNQIGGAMDQIRQAMAQLDAQTSEAYEQLDAQVKALSDQIEAEAQSALTAIGVQQAQLQKEILRQEVSPVIYDHYRRILGRDPSSAEYDQWIEKIDYETGKVFEGFEDRVDWLPGASSYFSGSYLTVTGNEELNVRAGDFTVDGWYRFETTGPAYLFSQTQTGGSGTAIALRYYAGNLDFYMNDVAVVANAAWTPVTGQWYHVAVVRAGNSVKVFVDGQAKGVTGTTTQTVASASRFFIGAHEAGVNYFNGWADEFRFTKGLARWTSAFTPSAERTAPDAATKLLLRAQTSGTPFKDFSASARVITPHPAMKADAAVYKTMERKVTRVPITQKTPRPGASIAFDGSGDYLRVPDSADFDFGAGDFTIDFWVKLNRINTQQGFIYRDGYWYEWGLLVDASNKVRFVSYSGSANRWTVTGTTSLQQDTWYHIAAVRSGSTQKLYVNGVEEGVRGTFAGALADGSDTVIVGSIYGGQEPLDGLIDELRISKGIARWTAGFTPSQVRYEMDAQTKLLLRASVEGTVIQDVSVSRPITLYGNVSKSASARVSDVVVTPILHGVPEALAASLGALPELAQRQAYVANVKTRVNQKLQTYLSMTLSQKEAYASSLGLSSSDLIALSVADTQKILVWLDSRSLHFGQSAFLSLESLMDQKGISYAREDLAEKAILIDVLTGIISPLDDGDLVISMFALNKTAQSYGLSLSGANVSFEDLLALYQSNPSGKIIAHVNGNHYVVISSMTADSVTYMDPGRGQDKQNEVMTLSRKDFLKGWQGDVTLEQSNLQVLNGYQSKVLSVERTQKIRGAFFFLFIPAIIGAFASIGGAIAAVLAGIGTIIAGVGTLVAGALSSIGGFLATVAQGIGYIGSAIWQGISFAASSLWGALGNVGTFLSQTVFGSLAKASFGHTLFQTAVKVGINFAVSKGLDALGVNPVISNLAAAFVTGGLTFRSALPNISAAANFFQGGIQGLALEGSQTLLQKVGLDANLTSVLSLASGQFINGIFEGNLGGQLVKIAQNMGSGLSLYGIQRLSQSLGIDPRVSALIGAPIASGLSAAYQGGANAGIDVINAVRDGLTRGVANLAIDFAGQRLNLSPLVQGLAANALTGGLLGAFQYDGDVFRGAFESFIRSAANVLTLDGHGLDANDPNYSYQQMRHFAEMLEFSRSVSEVGLVGTLEAHTAQIFQRDAIENIFREGGIQAFLSSRAHAVQIGGVTYTEVVSGAASAIYLDPATGDMKGRVMGSTEEWGRFGFAKGGSFRLMDGRIVDHRADGSTMTQMLQSGNLVLLQHKRGTTLVSEIRPVAGHSTIVLNSDGSVFDGVIKLFDAPVEFTFENGAAASISVVPTGPDGVDLSGGFVGYLEEAAQDQLLLPEEQRAAARQRFNEFLDEEIRPLLLQDLTAEQVNDIFGEMQLSGGRIIDDPANFNAEAARMTAQATVPLGSIENAGDLGRLIQQKTLGWGLRMDLEGHPALGFATYFVGDQLGDIFKVGEGTAEALQDFQNGKIGHGLLGILSDVGRASVLGAAAAKLGKVAMVLATGSEASLTARASQAIKNLFKIGSGFAESTSSPGLRIAKEAAESFTEGAFAKRVLQEDEIWYRAIGPLNKDITHYLGKVKPQTAAQAQQMYNLTARNDMTEVVEIVVKKGTTVYEGAVKGGTGVQIYVENLADAIRKGMKVIKRESLIQGGF